MPKKTDWLRELGECAMRRMFEMAETDELKPELRLQAYKFVAEHALGKTPAPPEPAPDPLAGLSLSERREAVRRAAEKLA